MGRNLWLDSLREIRKNFGRYLSILAIVAVGVGFFAGVRAASPDMIETAQEYYQTSALMDIHFMSSLGLTDADLAAVRQLKGIAKVEAGYTLDTIRGTGENLSVVRVHSLPTEVNKIRLLSGRMPEAADECLVEVDTFKTTGLGVGDTLELKLENGEITDDLVTGRLKIVGTIESPYYITYDKGTSTAGSGSVAAYVMVRPEAFRMDCYTDIYATLTASGGLTFNTALYKETVADYVASLADFTAARAKIRTAEVKADAQKELDSRKAEALAKLSEARQELDNAYRQLNEAQQELDKQKQAADAGFVQAQEQLDKINAQLALIDPALVTSARANIPALQSGIAQLESGLAAAQAGQAQATAAYESYTAQAYGAQLAQIAGLKDQIAGLASQIAAAQAQLAGLASSDPQYAALSAQIADLSRQKAEAEAEQRTAQAALEAAQAGDIQYQQLAAARQSAQAQAAQLSAQLTAARDQLAKAQALVSGYDQLSAGKSQCESVLATQGSAYEKLAKAQQDIDKGRAEYEEGLTEYRQNYDQVQKELSDGQQKIDDLAEAKWYTFTRDDNVGYSEFGENASRIKAISRIFPTFFLLIAALVCLTSMTRMVEEHRGQIGTYKALGFTNGAIALKYLLYAGSATLIGSLLGLAIGFKLFPTVIFNAYNIMYRLPNVIAPFRYDEALEAVLLSEATTLSVTYLSCAGELRAVPASLLRPKAPKSGQRVLLEKWRWFWSRQSFSQKVTIRNLFRYKKRMAMTIVGIAGCTALTLAAFGIRDSVNAIGSIEFDEIMREDAIVVFNTDNGDLAGYLERSREYPIKEQVLITSQSVEVSRSGQDPLDVTIVVPEDQSAFKDLVDLRTLKGHAPLSLENSGAVISEKLSSLTGAKAGDELAFSADGKSYTVKVTGVAENYVAHYLWMSGSAYQEIFGKAAEPNQAYITAADNTDSGMSRLGAILVQDDQVAAMSKLTAIRENFNDAIRSLNTVVYVLLLSACALAFIVLYNLVNINITERIRELATIKVLGFRDPEVTQYLYRENLILTLLGIAGGLIGGIFLHKIIMDTLEIDTLLFGQRIYGPSFLYAAAITMSFSLIVNIFTHFSLKRIDMIESLKSVE